MAATRGSDPLADARAALYGLSPEDFIAARDERVRALKADGARDVAAQVARLRRPTVSAWLVNRLVADEPALLGRLAELAEQLRAAQTQLSGEELRALGRQRQQLVSGLVARARQLAGDQGRPVHEDVLAEVESSLRAALADPDVAREVLSGQLVRAADYVGFGPTPSSTTAPARPPAEPAKTGRTASAKQREEADERLRQSRQSLQAAEAEQKRVEAAVAKAAEARAAAEQRLEWLRSQLNRAGIELEEAQNGEAQADVRLAAAADAVAAAAAVADAERERAALDEG